MGKFLLLWICLSAFLLVLLGGPDLLAYLTHNEDFARYIEYSGIKGFYRLLIAAPIAGAVITATIFLLKRYFPH
jgi:hypothetical protein